MLRVYADAYLTMGARIVALQNIYDNIAHRVALSLPEEGDREILSTAPKTLSEDEQATAKELFESLGKLCDEVNLPVSSNLAKFAVDHPPESSQALDYLGAAFSTELKSQLFLFVPQHRAKYYEMSLDETITMAFPSSSNELRAAGNSLAAGLYTAAVFHSMRAAEIGVRTLGRELRVTFPDKPLELAEWQNILDQSDSKIVAMKALKRGSYKDETLHFYSQAAVQFRYFKDAWRVRVAHARESYEESQALMIFNHTLEFFQTLSTQLKEQDA